MCVACVHLVVCRLMPAGEAGKLHIYVISMYVTTMTLTTVGYGDIGAENTGERIGYILLFVVGAFIWGDLLATVCVRM
jgi:voltage-gated potassium channel Kch